MNPKVFGVGFHKTGTKSLAAALRELGYNVTGPNGYNDPDIKQNAFEMACRLAEEFDAFQDNPWPIFYKEMDAKYPGSKFILTMRSTESWIGSLVGNFGSKHTPMREWIYGVGWPKGNEQIYIDRYERHNREVFEYFKNRPDDLLLLDVPKGDGWEKLCAFLNKPIPNIPFPHMNKTQKRE